MKPTKDRFQFFEDMGTYTYEIPVWFNKAILERKVVSDDAGTGTFIKNEIGFTKIDSGDWVVRNEDGSLRVMDEGEVKAEDMIEASRQAIIYEVENNPNWKEGIVAHLRELIVD